MKRDRTPLHGLLILVGAWQIVAGWIWIDRPTPSRIAGVEWMPIQISTQHIGVLLLVSGVIALAGGLLYRFSWLGKLATYAAITVPILAASPFIGAAVETGNPDRLQTVYSYSTYSLAVLWVAYCTYRDQKSDRGGDQ